MSDVTIISGLYLFPLNVTGESLVFIRDDDHLLRRFGQVEIRKIPAKFSSEFVLRAVADEIWTTFIGSLEFILIDRRQGSASENQALKLILQAENQQGLLIPFGVAYSFHAEEDSQAIRVTTHADGTHAEDRIVPREALSDLTSNL